jgi:hypothetical protein
MLVLASGESCWLSVLRLLQVGQGRAGVQSPWQWLWLSPVIVLDHSSVSTEPLAFKKGWLRGTRASPTYVRIWGWVILHICDVWPFHTREALWVGLTVIYPTHMWFGVRKQIQGPNAALEIFLFHLPHTLQLLCFHGFWAAFPQHGLNVS